MPQNIVAAASGLKTFNLVPAIGEQRAPLCLPDPQRVQHGPVQILYLQLGHRVALGSDHPPPPNPQFAQAEHWENDVFLKENF